MSCKMDKFLALCCCFNAYFIGFRSIFISLESLLTESNIEYQYLFDYCDPSVQWTQHTNLFGKSVFDLNFFLTLTWSAIIKWFFLEYSIWKCIRFFRRIKTKRYYDKISPWNAQIKQYKIDDFFYSYCLSMILTNIPGCRKWISHFEEKKTMYLPIELI